MLEKNKFVSTNVMDNPFRKISYVRYVDNFLISFAYYANKLWKFTVK